MRLQPSSLVLLGIIVLFLLKGVFIIFLIPPWEAPDEPEHASYVLYLVHQKRVPSATQMYMPASIEESLHKSREYVQNLATRGTVPSQKQELFDRTDRSYTKTANLASHPPLYYLYLIPYYLLSLAGSSYGSIILMRLGSLILGVVALWLSYSLARHTFPDQPFVALLVPLLLSIQPMATFISGIINSDILVVIVFLLFVQAFISCTRGADISRRDYIIFTLVTSIAPLVKPQLVISIPLFLLAMGYAWRQGQIPLKQTLLTSGIVVLPLGVWFLYTYSLEGANFLSYAVQHVKSTPAPFWEYPIAFIRENQPVGIFMSFWGFFGWLSVPMPKWVYVLYAVCIILSGFGWVLGRKGIPHQKISLIFLFVSLVYASFIFLYDVQTFVLSHGFGIQGRYFAPILPLLLILFVQGIWFLPKEVRITTITIVCGVFLIGQVVMITTLSQDYYNGLLFFPLREIFLL